MEYLTTTYTAYLAKYLGECELKIKEIYKKDAVGVSEST